MKAAFFIAELAASADEITLYDQEHFLTYARLIDAELDGADWREMARHILLLDPDADPERARRCVESHLERAKWVETTGLKKVIEQAQAAEPES
jgi:hypothetical protein